MKRVKKSFPALGTINSISISYEESMELHVINSLEEIKTKVCMLDDLLSVFKETSEIAQINIAAGRDTVPVSRETYSIITKAIRYSELSEGAFDITIRPLSRLWSIGKKGDYIPSNAEIMDAKQYVNYKDIIVLDKPMRIGLKKAGQEIDLGSIAKGYAADEASRILTEHNISNAVINFGGTVIVTGNERKVGIQNPERKTGTSMATIKVKDKAIVTSGYYERYFIKDGRRYHHLLDPRTGMPADTDLSSVSLIGSSAALLDALTTMVFVSGLEASLPLLERYQLEGILVNTENNVFVTKGLQNNFEFIKEMEIDHYETATTKC